MRVIIKADNKENLILAAHRLSYFLENVEETGFCAAIFQRVATREEIAIDCRKIKTGYSLTAWNRDNLKTPTKRTF